MLDVKRLRVLRAVAEHGTFKDAAEALSYSQPRISQQVAALEREVGTTLVERGPKGVRLTDAGRALVDHAEGLRAAPRGPRPVHSPGGPPRAGPRARARPRAHRRPAGGAPRPPPFPAR